MASPFCAACGAAVTRRTRFCAKCGAPVGQVALPQAMPVTPLPPVPPPSPPMAPVHDTVVTTAPKYVEPPLPPSPYAPITPLPLFPPPVSVPAPQAGLGAGLWVGLIGLILLLGGLGLWYVATHMQVTPPNPVQTAEAGPSSSPAPLADSAPAPSAPQENASQPAKPVEAERQTPAPQPVRQPVPPPVAIPAAPANPTSGVLHASVEVAQYGEVVFQGLPADRLRFIFDHDAWQPTIHRQPNGTQTLVMRSLKPGIQRSCNVKWEIMQ